MSDRIDLFFVEFTPDDYFELIKMTFCNFRIVPATLFFMLEP